ncbi:MAG: peptide chain release factor N(5)-glutamine methyltransferase [Candidatus Nomurabacteria bacterium]|jgi:methylase of polypeptide subunit release factors|nr:peptide chain release factor N(5)-glutamine methyltransferase [Candidatus Nomurabacteria bacterium]
MNSGLWLKKVVAKIDRLDAELILAEVLGVSRAGLHAHPERILTDTEVTLADGMVARRGKGEPVAYIVGWKEFFGRKFEVNRDVLVPRPETEALVEAIIDLGPRKVLDVGTGSGVIAISLALELLGVGVVGLDISEKALGVARSNAEELGAKVEFLKSDLLGVDAEKNPHSVLEENTLRARPSLRGAGAGVRLEVDDQRSSLPQFPLEYCADSSECAGLRSVGAGVRLEVFSGGMESGDSVKVLGLFDVIVANLPYVDRGWWWNSGELGFEPEDALFAGDGGLELIKRLVVQAPEHLERGGRLVLEADEVQHGEIIEFTEAFGWELERIWGLALVFRLG